jgi:hypothetical protein
MVALLVDGLLIRAARTSAVRVGGGIQLGTDPGGHVGLIDGDPVASGLVACAFRWSTTPVQAGMPICAMPVAAYASVLSR